MDDMKSVTARMVIDEVNVYAITSEVKAVQEKKKIQFSPMIEIKRPGVNNVQLFGTIALERPMKSLNIDMTLTGIQKLPYTIKCKFQRYLMPNRKCIASLLALCIINNNIDNIILFTCNPFTPEVNCSFALLSHTIICFVPMLFV